MDRSYVFVPNRYRLEAYPGPEIDGVIIKSHVEDGLWGIYSEYFTLKNSRIKRKFDWTVFIFQLSLIGIFYIYFRTGFLILDIFTIDSTLSAVLFTLKWRTGFLNFKDPMPDYMLSDYIYQSNYIKRLLYFVFLISGIEIWNLITWWTFPNLDYVFVTFMMSPAIIEEILFSYHFKKVYHHIRIRIDNFMYHLMSKQLGKALVKIARIGLHCHVEFEADEFVKHLQKFSYRRILSFLSSLLIAALLHYLESGGTTIYTALIRQYYFREYVFKNEDREGDTQKYLRNLLQERRWNKLKDPYTLNRILQLYVQLTDDGEDNFFMSQMVKISNIIGISFAKIMAAWSFMGVIPIRGAGSLSYLLFCEDFLHFSLICVFTVFSYVCDDQILMLILCEITYQVLSNPLSRDIAKEIRKKMSLERNPAPMKGSLALLPVYLLTFQQITSYYIISSVYLVLHRTIRPSVTVDSMLFTLITSQVVFFSLEYITETNRSLAHMAILPVILQIIFYNFNKKTIKMMFLVPLQKAKRVIPWF